MESDPIILETPSMPQEGIAYLTSLMKHSKCYLEYGAGGSSRLAARMHIKKIFTVDSDEKFLKAVELAVLADNPEVEFRKIYCDIGPIGNWGRPIDNSKFEKWPMYSVYPWKIIKNKSAKPDLVLIDGRFRPACFLASLLYLENGATIFFDDYEGRRRRYAVVEKFAKLTEMVDRAAVFRIEGERDYRGIALELARQCVRPG